MYLTESIICVKQGTNKRIAQLNDKDRSIVMEIINTMLTKQKFSDFF